MAKKLALFTQMDLHMAGEALRLLEAQYKTTYGPNERACLAMSLADVEYLRRKISFVAANVKVTTEQRNAIYQQDST